MKTFVETLIPPPYIIGAEFHIEVSPPDGVLYKARATVTRVFTPFTISPVMKVYLEPLDRGHQQLDLPSELIFKVYDRRFSHSLREFHEAKPPTFESESVYRQYVGSGNAPKGLAEIDVEIDANCLRGLTDDPPELIERMLAIMTAEHFGSECATYNRLAYLQGRYIPRFYSSTRFLDEPNPSIDPSVPGILLEFIPGVSLDRVDPSSVNIDILLDSALKIPSSTARWGC